MAGEFEQAPLLKERELSGVHGVSHVVIREAVKMLTAKGLLSARPRQGTAVEPISSWNLLDPDVLRWLFEGGLSRSLLEQLNQLRAAIEPEAAALAARFASCAEISIIAAAHARLEAVEQNPHERLDAQIAFHLAILRASGNPFYLRLGDCIHTSLRASARFQDSPTARAKGVSLSGRVLKAVAAREADAARVTMQILLSNNGAGP